jgi:multiple sugar transport system substrate-binding protein
MSRLVWLGCCVLLLLAAGCGGASTSPQSAAEDDSENAANSSAKEEQVTVTLAYNRFLQTSFSDSPPPLEVIQQAVAEQYPNITIQLNLVPDSVNAHHDALAVWMTSEDPTIDIYGMDTPWVLEFGEAGWAEPLNEHLPDLEERFVESGLDVFTYQGDQLGVPFWGSIGGLFYRADLLEEYGFAPPETYDDLAEAAEAIMAEQPELSGFVWPGSRNESLIQTWAEIFLGFGGTYFDDTGACAINSAAGVDAVNYMRNAVEEGLSPRETTAWTAEEARTRFVSGEAIFLRHNHDIVTWLDDPERSQIAGQWGFMPNPAQPDGQHAGATGGFAFAINPHTDTLEEAVQVLDIIASEEVQKGFAMAWGPVQYYEGLYDDPEVREANPNVELIEDVLSTAAPRPLSTNYAQLSDILQEELHSALTDIKPVQDALDDVCSRIEALP